MANRYFISFRNSDTGLTPVFTFFKKASDLTNQAPPTIVELSNGSYYFDYTPAFDIVFQVDGTATITPDEIRYVTGSLGPADGYIDEPTSQVKDDVWNAVTTGYTVAGSFGQTLQLSDSGALQAGGASTATLKAGSSALTDFYKNALLVITAGTGIGQSRSITSYDGGTKIATVDRAWATVPVASSEYMVVPAAPSSGLTSAGIAGAVWDEAAAGHVVAGSFGARSALDSSNLLRALGMLHENSVLDNTSYTVDNNLQTGRLRIYDSKANADAALAAAISALPGSSVYDTGKIAEYAISATYVGTNLTTYKMSKE